MLKTIEKRIIDFSRLTGLTERITMSHGTLYVTLIQPERCDHFHKVIRTFYKDQINNEGGVNMYAVGDEFAFDFVPEDREAPVFMTEDEEAEAQAEIQMDLEADAKEGR